MNTLSPNTNEYKSISASISLNIDRIDTVSVADISEPKAKLSFNENLAFDNGVYPIIKNNIPDVNIVIKVPKNEYNIKLPMFLKNGFFFILYPDSNIIGGNNRIKNILTKWLDRLVI